MSDCLGGTSDGIGDEESRILLGLFLSMSKTTFCSFGLAGKLSLDCIQLLTGDLLTREVGDGIDESDEGTTYIA
jgi:hypothetical protein